MSLVMQAVQQALVFKMLGDAVLMDRVDAVYDTVPQRSALPYLYIATIEQESRDQVAQAVWEVRVELEVWTSAEGRKQAMAVLERLQAILHQASLSVSGYSVQEMRVIAARCDVAERQTRVVGTMELLIVVQQA
jgi:predicted transcriptional regulator